MNVIVARIYELIAQSGISKVNLADKIGVSRNTIQNWKKADAYPSLAVIEKLCEVFGITTEQFFSGIGNTENKSEMEFLNYWRVMGDKEKLLITNAINTFLELRKVQK